MTQTFYKSTCEINVLKRRWPPGVEVRKASGTRWKASTIEGKPVLEAPASDLDKYLAGGQVVASEYAPRAVAAPRAPRAHRPPIKGFDWADPKSVRDIDARAVPALLSALDPMADADRALAVQLYSVARRPGIRAALRIWCEGQAIELPDTPRVSLLEAVRKDPAAIASANVSEVVDLLSQLDPESEADAKLAQDCWHASPKASPARLLLQGWALEHDLWGAVEPMPAPSPDPEPLDLTE